MLGKIRYLANTVCKGDCVKARLTADKLRLSCFTAKKKSGHNAGKKKLRILSDKCAKVPQAKKMSTSVLEVCRKERNRARLSEAPGALLAVTLLIFVHAEYPHHNAYHTLYLTINLWAPSVWWW